MYTVDPLIIEGLKTVIAWFNQTLGTYSVKYSFGKDPEGFQILLIKWLFTREGNTTQLVEMCEDHVAVIQGFLGIEEVVPVVYNFDLRYLVHSVVYECTL